MDIVMPDANGRGKPDIYMSKALYGEFEMIVKTSSGTRCAALHLWWRRRA
ncbi:MAG: hypothetical protein ACRD1W_16935 [Vicinamibacterales bacterium]